MHGRGWLVIVTDEFVGLVGAEFRAWLRQMERLGGCASPVYLVGHTLTRDTRTGELLHVFTSASQPYGRFAVGCGNRRESVCLPCSYLHKGDTYQIVVSGLAGGKGVPESVVVKPRVFATLTAPSFGLVHRCTSPDNPSQVCRARRDAPLCPHGASQACFRRHSPDDPRVGSPLCPACYDYTGAVIWNASLGKLWRRTLTRIARELGKAGGIRQQDLKDHFRVSFAKVVEYQHRGLVHLHVVVRCDGPDGPGDPAPAWVTATLLGDAVAAAAGAVTVRSPAPDGADDLVIGWGAQLDVQEIQAGEGLDGLSNQAVAAYVAKYVSKGDINSLVLPTRLRSEGQIETTPGLSDHARRMMHECFTLAKLPRFATLRLDRWAFQVGFRGHIATKSQRYSTTYKKLRAERAAFYRDEQFNSDTTITHRSWRLDQIGHSPAQASFALALARTLQDRRDARNEERHAKRRAGWSTTSDRRPS